jgi:hypothetical protein
VNRRDRSVGGALVTAAFLFSVLVVCAGLVIGEYL